LLIKANTAKVGNEQEMSEGERDPSDDEADSKAPDSGDDGESAAKVSTTNPYQTPLLVLRLTRIFLRPMQHSMIGGHDTGRHGDKGNAAERNDCEHTRKFFCSIAVHVE
jgi:hypothetical protein